ncbi:MAG: hypothetical protein HY332_19750 [Chloroflexi bacterium]|nr:hypothetical protein [Chloroflexota bacterium]
MATDTTHTTNERRLADDAEAVEPVRLVLRLPPDVHRGLQEHAAINDRSLNREIVHALRRYVEDVTRIDYLWADTPAVAQAWLANAGATLTDDEGWDYTPEDPGAGRAHGVRTGGSVCGGVRCTGSTFRAPSGA